MQLFHSIHKAGGGTVIDEVVYVNLTTCAYQHLAVAQYYCTSGPRTHFGYLVSTFSKHLFSSLPPPSNPLRHYP
jgi:hypothetical protein